MTDRTMTQSAKIMAENNLFVLPVNRKTKVPFIQGGCKNATTDLDIIRRWFNQDFPQSNVAIATGKNHGGLVVIDIDLDDDRGIDGFDTLRKWEHEHGQLPETAMVKTGSGGCHYYYRTDKEVHNIQNARDAQNNPLGIDVRGEGGYVVAPPSIHANGNRYEWEQMPRDYPIADADEKVFDFIRFIGAKIEGEESIKEPFTLPEVIEVHSRNDNIYKLACSLQAKGMSDPAIMTSCLTLNREQTAQPLPESEVRRTVESALSHPKGNAGGIQGDWRADFHKWTQPDSKGNCHPRDTIDDRIVEDIIAKNNIFRLHGKIYIQDDSVPSYYIMDDDESILRSMIADYIYEDIRTSTRINRIYNLFNAKPQLRIEECDVNNYPKSWIMFRNVIVDAKTKELHEHDSKYRCINIIPYNYDPEYVIPDDSIVVQYLEDLIPQDDDRQMFLEYCGYSATLDTSLQRLLMLRGQGGVGKSVLLRLQKRFIGDKNCSGLTLQNLNDRFSPAFLFGKLMNIYADTPSTDMDEINGIKTITGEDTIRAEYKGGDVFFFTPYCKLLYSTNRVPKSRDDKTNAYYRRLLILPIEKRAKTIIGLEDRLTADIESYIHLCINAVYQLYQRGDILESESSKKEVLELYMATDSVQAFLHDQTEKDENARIERSVLYQKYCDYCNREGRERYQLSKNGFYQSLRDKGFGEISGRPERYFVGIRVVPDGFTQISHGDVPF